MCKNSLLNLFFSVLLNVVLSSKGYVTSVVDKDEAVALVEL